MPAPPAPQRAGPPGRRRVLTLLLRLADWAAAPHGRLILMGVFLMAIGLFSTLLSYLLRDSQTGQYRVWWLFLVTGAGCLVAGMIWRLSARR